MSRKVGIMGGTFNPIHNGHLAIAKCALDSFSLDEVMFIPTGNSYMKKDVLSADIRALLTKLAIVENEHFTFSDIEVSRHGNTYTFETLKSLSEAFPENDYYFIVGADSYVYMDKWKHPEAIFSKATILVAGRSGNSWDEVDEKISEYQASFNAKTEKLIIPNIDVSSTQIRELVKCGKSIEGLVPGAVEEYIVLNGLYVS